MPLRARELLAAIAGAPGDDMPRLVYGDFLADRGDPRGELIHVQCKLASGEGDARRLRAAEARLIKEHGASWASAAVELASGPSVPATARLRRGFVESLVAPADVLLRLNRLFEVAPTLDELELVGEFASHHLVSPALRRLRSLHVELYSGELLETVDPTEAPVADLLGACPYLTGLEALSFAPTARDSFPRPHPAIDKLACSPYLTNMRRLTFDRIAFDDTIDLLVGDRACWHVSHLALRSCNIDGRLVGRLLAGARVSELRVLDLEGNPLGATGIMRLANAANLRLDELRIANVGSDWPAMSPGLLAALCESQPLANTRIYIGGEPLARP